MGRRQKLLPRVLLVGALMAACKKHDRELADAIQSCEVDRVRAALDAGADPRAMLDKKPVFAGAAACVAAHSEVIDLLLERGAESNTKTASGVPLLVVAAEDGHAPCVRALLAKGALLDDRDVAGQTALMVAASAGHLGVVEILLDRHADPNLRSTSGQTAVGLAERNGHARVAATLRKAGAK